jgi:ribosomal protein L40E
MWKGLSFAMGSKSGSISELRILKAGYVISGMIFITLATVFAIMAGILAIIVYLNNLAASPAPSSTSTFAADTQNFLLATLFVSTIFYIGGGLFLWQGFKTHPAYSPPRYPVQYSTSYTQQPSLQQHALPTSATPTTSTITQPVTTSATTILASCPKCNARIPAEAKFCPSCGADLRPKPETDPVLKP